MNLVPSVLEILLRASIRAFKPPLQKGPDSLRRSDSVYITSLGSLGNYELLR